MPPSPRPRITIGRAMLAVAAIGGLLGLLAARDESLKLAGGLLLVLSPLAAIPLAIEANRREGPRR